MTMVRIKVIAPTKVALTDAITALQDGPFVTVKATATEGEYTATLQAEYPAHELDH